MNHTHKTKGDSMKTKLIIAALGLPTSAAITLPAAETPRLNQQSTQPYNLTNPNL
jgi:hypothetical protein